MKRISLVVLIALVLTGGLFAASLTADQIIGKVLDTQKSDSAALDLKLTLIEPNGTQRERRIQTLSKTVDGNTNTITVFLSPESVRNTRFLSRESNGTTEQYIYLPALKRSKRIAASEEGGSFMGSDFSYADMASTTYDTDQADHKLIAEDASTYTIESTPFKKTVYGKNIVIVDRENFLPVRVEFYDLDGRTLLKTLETLQSGMEGGRHITKVLVMTTVATGHSTRLEIMQARYDMPISDNYFTQRFLETGR